jgi:hypothetical protein
MLSEIVLSGNQDQALSTRRWNRIARPPIDTMLIARGTSSPVASTLVDMTNVKKMLSAAETARVSVTSALFSLNSALNAELFHA